MFMTCPSGVIRSSFGSFMIIKVKEILNIGTKH